MSNELAALKKQADEMGLAYHPNIGAAKLREKIDAANAENPAVDAQAFYNERMNEELQAGVALGFVEIVDNPPAADPVDTLADASAPTVAEVLASLDNMPTFPREALQAHTNALLAKPTPSCAPPRTSPKPSRRSCHAACKSSP